MPRNCIATAGGSGPAASDPKRLAAATPLPGQTGSATFNSIDLQIARNSEALGFKVRAGEK